MPVDNRREKIIAGAVHPRCASPWQPTIITLICSMRSQDTQQHSGRRSRRGPRRPQRGGGGGSPSHEPAPPRAPEKVTFWQKVTAFFTGKQPEQSEQPVKRDNGYKSAPRTDRFSGPERAAGSDRPPSRPVRKPEIVEVSSPKLYVGNLSFDAAESDLFDLFNGVGTVQNAEIVTNKYTQKSKGFAFVTMQSIDEAKRAVVELHDKDFMGRKLVVSGAKTSDTSRENRDSRDARG